MQVGNRAPNDKSAGREKAHEERQTTGLPRNGTACGKERGHVLALFGKGHACRKYADGEQSHHNEVE